MSEGLSALLVFHIAAGISGLVFGTTALLARKGAWLHRKAGNAFFIAMMLMAASGVCVAVLKPAAASFNSVVGVVTFYMVATSWVTIVRKEGAAGAFEIVALVVALAAGAGAVAFGVAANAAKGTFDGIPAGVYFFFGAIALTAALLDLRVIRRGGVSGAHRIARHLWRMCFALFLGALAFFLGQAHVFPKWVRDTQLLGLPVIAVLMLMAFWLARVLLTRRYKGTAAAARAVPSRLSERRAP